MSKDGDSLFSFFSVSSYQYVFTQKTLLHNTARHSILFEHHSAFGASCVRTYMSTVGDVPLQCQLTATLISVKIANLSWTYYMTSFLYMRAQYTINR